MIRYASEEVYDLNACKLETINQFMELTGITIKICVVVKYFY